MLISSEEGSLNRLFDKDGAGIIFSINSPVCCACVVSENTVNSSEIVVILIVVFIEHWIKSLTKSTDGMNPLIKLQEVQ